MSHTHVCHPRHTDTPAAAPSFFRLWFQRVLRAAADSVAAAMDRGGSLPNPG